MSASVHDPEGNRDVPSVLLEPQAITFDSVKDVVADGYVSKDELCKDLADKCKEAGIE